MKRLKTDLEELKDKLLDINWLAIVGISYIVFSVFYTAIDILFG